MVNPRFYKCFFKSTLPILVTLNRRNKLGYHKGTVWDLDPSWDSQFLLTAGSDDVARMFEVTTGKYILRMPHRGLVSDLYSFECVVIPFT